MTNRARSFGRLGVIKAAAMGAVVSFAVSCSGGGGGDGGRPEGSAAADFGCDGSCANQQLLVPEVQRLVTQAIRSAEFLGVRATFAVVDRVGNVLALYQMEGALPTSVIDGQNGAVGGLEGLEVPSVLAAVSKAGTGAFLSSQGNAFTTRTASQIIQEHFNPPERGQPGGPLFGVQFSQLMCSDVTTRNPEFSDGRRSGINKRSFSGSVGPRALPLGLSADPGGIPIYKQGDLVGGLGVELDGRYTLDRNTGDFDDDIEERIAMMATQGGFEAPSERVGPNMNVGKSLRYTDLTYDQLDPVPTTGGEFDSSRLVALPEFSGGMIREGVTYGTPQSGVARTARRGLPAAVLVDGAGAPRFPTRGGAGGLTAGEVDALLDSALTTASRTRAAIRRPLDTPANVSIWVVDVNGEPLGFTRSADGPVFGIDVSLQKARSALFMSSPEAAARLIAAGQSGYVVAAQNLVGPAVFSDGTAFGNRSVANLARPFFPDGIEDKPNGPLSLPYPGTSAGRTWSPFNTGLQLDLAFGGIAQALGLVPSAIFPDSCVGGAIARNLANGLQIFPGGVPLFKGETLVGGIGISGDGVDQDDLIAFFSTSRRGLDFVGHTAIGDPVLGFNPPPARRADALVIGGGGQRLRYVNCPEAPFSGDNDQNVCDGL